MGNSVSVEKAWVCAVGVLGSLSLSSVVMTGAAPFIVTDPVNVGDARGAPS